MVIFQPWIKLKFKAIVSIMTLVTNSRVWGWVVNGTKHYGIQGAIISTVNI